jgi:signal transduction histidine kinase
MANFREKNFIYVVVAIINVLLIADIVVTYYNNTIIERNRALQNEAETIKLFTEQIGKSTIHGIDIGLRGYAIMREDRFFSPVDSAILRKDSILNNIESRLIKQGYNKLDEFHVLRDSLQEYVNFCLRMRKLLAEGKESEFLALFSSDKGLFLWLQYLQCQKNIAAFEDRINAAAQSRYGAALRRNYVLQIFLFVICLPTLLYTAFHTRKTFKLSYLLHQSEADKNKLLTEQNQQLETSVTERTKEILLQSEALQQQSEEIASQRDTLAEQNKKLLQAHTIIERHNEVLEAEVDLRTQQLKQANQELIDQNNQLEQFAFISAHNLRAPLARILGLAHIMELSDVQQEKESVMQRLVTSTKDLDNVIRDLNTILDIKKHTSNFIEVDLQASLERVNKSLEREYEETNARLNSDFNAAQKVYAVGPYVDSILYNLISNSIKYRHPEREPKIIIRTQLEHEYVKLTIADNGLGIDLLKHRKSMFNLYKRFHLHMEGRGLGLYLIKTQMVALGGKIDVESEPEIGTTFSVYFKKEALV